MAGFIDDLKLFDDYVITTMTEVEAQVTDVFNSASNGGIMLSTRMSQGAQRVSNFWKKKSGAGVFTVEAAADQNLISAPLTPINLEQEELREPKIKYRVGPYQWERGALSFEGLPGNAAAVALGQQLGIEIPLGKLKLGIAGAIACLTKTADTMVDFQGTTAVAANRLDIKKLVNAKAKFGDRFGRLGVILMHSKPFFDLALDNIDNYKEVFNYPGFIVRTDPFGTPIIVMDNAELMYTHNSLTKYYVLLLPMGGVNIYDSGDFFTNEDTPNLQKRIMTTYQGEGSVQLGIKGFSYTKSVAAAASPTITDLKAGANWTQVCTDIKDCAGVVMRVQGTQ